VIVKSMEVLCLGLFVDMLEFVSQLMLLWDNMLFRVAFPMWATS